MFCLSLITQHFTIIISTFLFYTLMIHCKRSEYFQLRAIATSTTDCNPVPVEWSVFCCQCVQYSDSLLLLCHSVRQNVPIVNYAFPHSTVEQTMYKFFLNSKNVHFCGTWHNLESRKNGPVMQKNM